MRTQNMVIYILTSLVALAVPQTIYAVDYLYASWGNDSVVRFDLSSDSPISISNSLEVVASGLAAPRGLAFSSRGDLYVVSMTTDMLYAITPNGNINSTGVGLTRPIGIAFDQNDNLYVGNSFGYNANTISIIPPGSNASLFSKNVGGPEGLFFNGGYLYSANIGSDSVSKIDSNGIGIQLATGIASATGITGDSSGNLFVTGQQSNILSKVEPNGTVSVIANGLYTPIGIAYDSAGFLYVANSGNNTISKLDRNGNLLYSFSTGASFPTFITLHSTVVPEPTSLCLTIVSVGVLSIFLRRTISHNGPKQ